MKALRRAELPVLILVWMLCVGTDWSTGAKIALNVAAVAALCLKELAVHRHLLKAGSAAGRRAAPARRLVPAA